MGIPKEDKTLNQNPSAKTLQDRDEKYRLALNWRENGGRQSLPGFDLSGRDLTVIDLAGANLFEADLTGANLDGVDFTMATMPDGRRLGD